MSVDERLISRVRSAGSVVGSVSTVGFMDPHFWPQEYICENKCNVHVYSKTLIYSKNNLNDFLSL